MNFITRPADLSSATLLAALLISITVGLVTVSNTALAQSPTKPAIKIMPLGDSITQGASDYHPSARGRYSYRRALYQALAVAGYAVDFVGSMHGTEECSKPEQLDFDPDHEGHWGWRVEDVLRGFELHCAGAGKLSHWLVDYAPDIALVHLGSNDALMAQSRQSTLTELAVLIETLRARNPAMAIFLAQIIPVHRPQDPDANQRIIELNRALPALVKLMDSERSRVYLVDQFTGFNAEDDTYDGIHPNAVGEKKMAVRWFSALDRYLSQR